MVTVKTSGYAVLTRPTRLTMVALIELAYFQSAGSAGFSSKGSEAIVEKAVLPAATHPMRALPAISHDFFAN